MTEKKSFRIDVLLARESPSSSFTQKQWESSSPSVSPISNSRATSLSPPISPGSEATSIQSSSSPIHHSQHISDIGHNVTTNEHQMSIGMTPLSSRHHHPGSVLNGTLGLLMNNCGMSSLRSPRDSAELDFAILNANGGHSVNGVNSNNNNNDGGTNNSSESGNLNNPSNGNNNSNGAVVSSAAQHHHFSHHHHQRGPIISSSSDLFNSLHSYGPGSLGGFSNASAFHLPSISSADGVSNGCNPRDGESKNPLVSSSSSPFVGLSVANAHQLQLEWLARNGMLYPRLPDLAGNSCF